VDSAHLCLHALCTLLVIQLVVYDPLLALRVLKDLVASMSRNDSAGWLRCSLCLASGISPDSGVHLLVELSELHATESLLPLAELLLEARFAVFLKIVIVALNVLSEDVSGMLLGIEK